MKMYSAHEKSCWKRTVQDLFSVPMIILFYNTILEVTHMSRLFRCSQSVWLSNLYVVYIIRCRSVVGGRCRLRWGRPIFYFILREWPYFYYWILEDCHSHSIHPAQCNINRFRLLHDTQMFPIPIMRLKPSFRIKVYDVHVGAQVEREMTYSISPCRLLPASSWSRV
jgi:hypothetical protein